MLSIVQRKDRPSRGGPCWAFERGYRQAAGEPERNAVPRTGDTMGMARAGDGFPTPATRQQILSVHTAVHSKGAAAFFYSTYFYLFPKRRNTKPDRHTSLETFVYEERRFFASTADPMREAVEGCEVDSLLAVADAVADKVKKAGYDPYEPKPLGITAMEKLLGKIKRYREKSKSVKKNQIVSKRAFT